RTGWLVEIDPAPSANQIVVLSNVSVSSSGDREQFLELEGKRYSHIVDPRTGMPLSNGAGASIIAQSGMLADALATAVCVMGKEAGTPLAESHKAQVYIVP